MGGFRLQWLTNLMLFGAVVFFVCESVSHSNKSPIRSHDTEYAENGACYRCEVIIQSINCAKFFFLHIKIECRKMWFVSKRMRRLVLGVAVCAFFTIAPLCIFAFILFTCSHLFRLLNSFPHFSITTSSRLLGPFAIESSTKQINNIPKMTHDDAVILRLFQNRT